MRTAELKIAAMCLAAATAAGVVACGGDGASKAGGSGPPVTLRIGTDDPPGRPSGDAIEQFARQVARRSHDRIRVRAVYTAVGNAARDWDQRVARRVSGGELEMGMIPARAWDTEGVSSLRALHDPFLVTSDALVADLVTGELGREMLAGLGKAGVVGLALLPEGLRHPASFGAPLLGPADYEGAVVRVPRSDTADALFRALGADPRDLNGDAFKRGVESKVVRAAESSFQYELTSPLPQRAVYTGNVTLYPKVNSLVISKRAYDDLSADQRRVLRQAAAATATKVLDAAPSDAAAAARYCKQGGTVVSASAADLRGLGRAAAPVDAELAKDPATRAMIDRIRELKRRLPAASEPTVQRCGGGTRAPATHAGGAAVNLDGVYRYEVPVDYLVKHGLKSSDAREEGGVHTVTLDHGTFTDAWRNAETAGKCVGSYDVAGHGITIVWKGPCQGDWTMTFARDGNRLTFRDIRTLPPIDDPYTQLENRVFNRVGWTKIG